MKEGNLTCAKNRVSRKHQGARKVQALEGVRVLQITTKVSGSGCFSKGSGKNIKVLQIAREEEK